MIETCANCNYFHDTISDSTSDYHIHYWCSAWRSEIPSDTSLMQYDDDGMYWDDIECGIAKCHHYKPCDEERLSEELVSIRRCNNKKEHIKQQLKNGF